MKKQAMGALALTALAGLANASIVEANFGDGITTSAAGLARIGESFSDRMITPGDTYSAALLGQTAVPSAGFVTAVGRTTSFAYPTAATNHGTLVGSNATVRMQSAQVLIAPNILRVVIACFTTNNTNLWISGLNIGGNPMTQGRFDVGSTALGGNGLSWDNLPGAVTSVSIFSALWSPSNGFAAPVATSTALTNQGSLTNFGSAVVWNGVVGNTSIVSEVNMIFDITFVPTPGTASLLAFGGLIAARRRRA